MTAKGQVRFSFPAWRAYIFGLDVTDDVSSITVNWNDGRAPNTAEIVLSSEQDKYVVTPGDIHALYDDIPVEFIGSHLLQALENGDFTPDNRKSIDDYIQERLNTIPDPNKRRVLKKKVNVRVENQIQPQVSDGLECAVTDVGNDGSSDIKSGEFTDHKVQAFTGDFLRFPFQVGHCIFHTGDDVRIFLRNPFDPTEWFFGMTGHVADWSERVDTNGKRTVTILVQDALRLYNLARVTTNPGLADFDVLDDKKNDAQFRSFFGDLGLADLTLPEILFLLTFGTEVIDKSSLEKSNLQQEDRIQGVSTFQIKYYGAHSESVTEATAPLNGIFAFNEDDSEIRVFGDLKQDPNFVGPVQNRNIGLTKIRNKDLIGGTTMEQWQTIVDHKVPVQVQELQKLAIPAQQFNATQRLRSLGDDPNNLPVLEVMREIGEHPEIYPCSFGRLLMLVPDSLDPAANRSFLLKDFISGIATNTDYTSRLAMILNVVQIIDFSFYATPRGDIVCEFPLYSFDPSHFGKFANRYTFPIDDTISWSSHFEDEKVKTQIRAPFWLIENFKSLGTSDDLMFTPGTATLRSLIPMFGTRLETIQPGSFVNNNQAASYYAYIKLSQMNADAWEQTIETVARLGIGPNRPCWFEARDFIATIRSTSTSIVWGPSGSVQQNIRVNYRRGWSGQVVNGQHIYESFGGRASEPINYALLFGATEDSPSTKEETGQADKGAASLADSLSDEQLALINGKANDTVDALNKRGLFPAVTSVFRSGAQDAALSAKLLPKANAGDTNAQRALALINSGEDPHNDGRAFDMSLGQGDANQPLYDQLNQLKSEGFFPPGTVIVNESSLNHVHVQLPRSFGSRKTGWQ